MAAQFFLNILRRKTTQVTEDEELTYIIFLQFCPLTIAHEYISELNYSKQKLQRFVI